MMGLYKIEGVEDSLVESICVILKKKWMNNDHVVDIKKLCKHFKVSDGIARKVISWYESQLISTKFELI